MLFIVFDLDGTLVDSQASILASHAEAFSGLGLSVPSDRDLLALVGLSLRPTFERLVGPTGPVDLLVERYREAFRRRVSSPGYREAVFAGADATLRRLAAGPGVTLGIATGKSRRGVERILASHDWAQLFATVQTADDAPSKPDPAMVEQAIAAADAASDRTVVVGDTTFDVAMARAAGVRAIGVAWGHHEPGLLIAAGAEHVVASFEELESCLATARRR